MGGGDASEAEPRQRLLDRAAMSTPEFDRGLWLLLGLSAVAFYLNPFGVGLGLRGRRVRCTGVVPVLCVVCGYVSGTRSSLAYIVPLNLLVTPAFFFADTARRDRPMVVLSALAAIGLSGRVGAAARARRRARSAQPARGSLRDASRPGPDPALGQ